MLSVPSEAIDDEDVIVEDTDAVLGLYSSNAGSGLGRHARPNRRRCPKDKWTMARKTTSGGDQLVFTFGTNANYAERMDTRTRSGRHHPCSCAEIAGADLAEKFPASEQAKPGLLMEIDLDITPANCVLRGAYNRRVAGVVSGAGDIPLGAVLGNLPGEKDSPPARRTRLRVRRCIAGRYRAGRPAHHRAAPWPRDEGPALTPAECRDWKGHDAPCPGTNRPSARAGEPAVTGRS